MRLNVKCVSIYTFSIENFSRPASEVDALMDLARGRFRELASKGYVFAVFEGLNSGVGELARKTSV